MQSFRQLSWSVDDVKNPLGKGEGIWMTCAEVTLA
jgi:hypothetical protein